MSKDVKKLTEELQAPFKPREIEWRMQKQGKDKNGKPWCMVLAYIDARALQIRLDEVFTPFGWYDSYEPLGEDFICTLTVDFDGKKVSKQNGASKTNVEGFKGGISNSFKRVCASGFGIGRYLYDLETNFAEVTMDNKQNDKNWKKASLKDGQNYINYFWKIPSLSWEFLPQADTITQEHVTLLKDKAKEKKQNVALYLQRFNLKAFGEMLLDDYAKIMEELEKL